MADPQQPASPDNQSFKDQRDILREINAELGKQINNVKDASKAYSGLEGIARKLQNDEEEISKLSIKQLKDLKAKAQANLRDLKTAAERLEYEDLSAEAGRALFMAKEEQFKVEQELLNNIQKRLDKEIKINEQLGLIGSLLKGISKIPIVGNMIDTEKALERARKTVEKTGSGILGMGSALASVGGDILKNLTDPLSLTVGLVTGFFKILLAGDKAIGDLAKGMNISYAEAGKLNKQLFQSAKNAEDLYANAKTYRETLVAVNQSLGTSALLSDKELKTFTLLRERAGYTNEELISIFKLTKATGGELEDNVKSFAGAVAKLNIQNKLRINEKQLLKEVATVSDRIKLSVGGTAESIAKAAFTAKQFGVNLQQAEKMADGLLNFEKSIEAEISAELLTGKQLNLEKARLLALNNDIAGAAAEVLRQVGSSAEFAQMNRIQQEAIAGAVNMTADELAKSLVEREALQKMGAKDAEEAERNLRARAEVVGWEQAIAESKDQAYAKQLEQNALAEDLNMIIIGLQESFMPIANDLLPQIKEFLTNNKETIVNMITGLGQFAMKLGKVLADGKIIEKIFNTVMFLVDNIGKIMTFIGTVAIARVITSLITMVASLTTGAAAATATNAAVTFGAGTLAIVGAIAAVLGGIAGAAVALSDGEVNKDGLVVGRYNKGAIQPIAQGLPDDNVIFTSNKPQANTQTGPSSVSINMEDVIKEQQHTNTLLRQLLVKEGGVYIDTTKSGTATTMGTYQIQ